MTRSRHVQSAVLKWTNDDVDMMDWIIPEDYDLNKVCHAVTYGPGWVLLKRMFSEKDIEMANERIMVSKLGEHKKFSNKDDKHNNFNGLTWGLLSRGKIFAKLATHPVILEVSRKLLGDKCRLSSLAANTVVPGMSGQGPHLDYPYYRHLWPSVDGCMNLPVSHMLSLQIVTLLTDFTSENGSTAIVPGSHINPRYPDNRKEFFKRAIQANAEAGDVLMFSGPIQHCAMPNKTNLIRSGILQHMVPVFVTPFECIDGDGLEDKIPELKMVLGIDFPHPIAKFTEDDKKKLQHI